MRRGLIGLIVGILGAVLGLVVRRAVIDDTGAERVTEKGDDEMLVSPHNDTRPPLFERKSSDKPVDPGSPTVAGSDGRYLHHADYHVRPESEWQGMLIDMNARSICGFGTPCSRARACLDDGKCGPCARDRDCEKGEVCVLDHCLLAGNVECRLAADCDTDELCVLSGYDGGKRGNETMTAYCQGNESTGLVQSRAAEYPASAFVGTGSPTTELLDRLDGAEGHAEAF